MGCVFAKVNNNYKLGSKYKIRRNFILQDSEQYGERCSMENVKDDSQSHKGWNDKLSRSEREGKE